MGGVWGEKPNSHSLGTPLEVGGFKQFLRPMANRPVRPSAHGSPLIFAVQPPQRWSQPASQKWILGSLVIPKSYQNPAELGGLSWPESESARNFVDNNVYEKFSEKLVFLSSRMDLPPAGREIHFFTFWTQNDQIWTQNDQKCQNDSK